MRFNYSAGVRQYKWRGWHQNEPIQNVKHFRMSFFVKFDSKVPPISENFGVKMHGHIFNDWVKTSVQGKWQWVEGDGGKGTVVDPMCEPALFTLLVRDVPAFMRYLVEARGEFSSAFGDIRVAHVNASP